MFFFHFSEKWRSEQFYTYLPAILLTLFGFRLSIVLFYVSFFECVLCPPVLVSPAPCVNQLAYSSHSWLVQVLLVVLSSCLYLVPWLGSVSLDSLLLLVMSCSLCGHVLTSFLTVLVCLLLFFLWLLGFDLCKLDICIRLHMLVVHASVGTYNTGASALWQVRRGENPLIGACIAFTPPKNKKIKLISRVKLCL